MQSYRFFYSYNILKNNRLKKCNVKTHLKLIVKLLQTIPLKFSQLRELFNY